MRIQVACTIVAALCLVSCCRARGMGSPAELKKADEAFDKGLFEEAYKAYEEAQGKAKDDEVRWRAFHRACESLTHLYRYGEAAQKVLATPPPDDRDRKARFLMLRAEILQNFLLQYSYIQPTEIIEEAGGEGKEPFRMTPAEVRGKVRESYGDLWQMREGLAKMDLDEEGYYFDVEDVHFGAYPTMLDYLVFSWTHFLLTVDASITSEKAVRPDGMQILVEEYARPVKLDDPPALLAPAVMEESGKIARGKRKEAIERWKVHRLLLPLQYGFYELDEKKGRGIAKPILLDWFESFDTSGGRASAGYEAAVLLDAGEEYVEAVKLCRKLEDRYPDTYDGYQAKILRANIEEPRISLEARTVLPPAKGALEVKTRNVELMHFRLYTIDPDTLRKEHEQNYTFNGWSGLFQYANQDWLKEKILTREPSHSWKSTIADKGDHKEVETRIDPPALGKGIYLVLASDDSGFVLDRSRILAAFLNVTDIVLVGTAGVTLETLDRYHAFLQGKGSSSLEDEAYRFYLLDGASGKPVPGADLDIYARVGYEPREKRVSTDESGGATLGLPVGVQPIPATGTYDYSYRYSYGNSYSADPIARKDGSFSYWSANQALSYTAPSPILLFIETDRPIYRPGHSVKAKIVAVKRTTEGFRTLPKGTDVGIEVHDPNGEVFVQRTLQLGEFGSTSLAFEIPQGRLLGSYWIRATCTAGPGDGGSQAYFTVEEYKQPEFEIALDEAKEPWKYGKSVEVKGTARYYFGGPVAGASLKYSVKRSMYVPWYYSYWIGDAARSGEEEVASGQMKAADDGSFKIAFTPTAPPRLPWQEKVPDISSFTVEVEARDAGGRTIQSSQAYKAGANALYFFVEPMKQFFSKDEKPEIEAGLFTINDTPSAGKSTYKVFRLADEPARRLEDMEGAYPSQGGYWGWIPPLDVQLAETASAGQVAAGEAVHDAEGKAVVTLPGLEPGAYRIVFTTTDAWGGKVEQEKILVAAGGPGEAVPLRAASVMLVEKDEYAVGEKARLVIGSDLASGTYHVEIWAGEYFAGSEIVEGGKVRVHEIPVTEPLKGGFAVRWFGIKDLEVHHGQASVAVPWKEKKLAVALDPFEPKMAPGQDVTWGIRIAGADGKPVQGETLALMYDRALEYYTTSYNPWLDGLYVPPPDPQQGIDSAFAPYVTYFSPSDSFLAKILEKIKNPPEPPKPPGLRTWDTWAGGRPGGLFRQATERFRSEEGAMDYAAAPAPTASAPLEEAEATAGNMKKAEAPARGAAPGQAGAKAAGVEARKAFADTAFFLPSIQTSAAGTASFSFKAPEQLTSWKIKVLSFTTDVREGTASSEAVTRKDLMVRADLPRFFREKDKGTITAIVHNESERRLEGTIVIEVTGEGESLHSAIGIGEDKRSFAIEPHSLASFDWSVDVPPGTGTWKVRVAAVAGDLADAEERDLPILPSRERLIESAFIALHDTEQKKLGIKLADDPTRMNESMTLQVDPQLALDLLNTIPFLLEYPYECVEQTLNRFVPLAIVNEIYKDHPAIQKAVSKVPKRDTITPPWEEDDPRRLITLMETPWVRQAQGYKPAYPMTDLLDPAVVAAEKEISLGKLKAAQLYNGAFPWFPGGREDLYITLLVLAGFAEARRYGVDLPQDVVDKALAYATAEIPKHLEKEESHLAITAYAAWVLTSFSPDEYSSAARAHSEARSWVKFLEKHIAALTPFGKAYLAYTHSRLGNTKRANEILDMIMDSAREDPITGVYWTPEKYSWVWYSDSVEKHAFILRTLQELRPNDSRIPGLVQWLVFNRKGNVWKSTKASAAAVFALLDHLEKTGALGSKQTFAIDWGHVDETIVVAPDDFLEEPLRWHVTGADITADMVSATIDKKGPGPAFASMTWIYTTDKLPEASAPGLLEIQRTFYRRVKKEDGMHLVPVSQDDSVQVGDEVVVKLKISTRSQFEYMHLKDPKAAGFESETLLSGWKWDPLSMYEEPRDSLTNFFVSWIPHGEYILSYTLRPTKPGTYRIGAATLQSMYAPEMTAHSAGFVIKVSKED